MEGAYLIGVIAALIVFSVWRGRDVFEYDVCVGMPPPWLGALLWPMLALLCALYWLHIGTEYFGAFAARRIWKREP